MKMKRIKPLVIPMIYGVCVIAFLFCMYFAGKLSNNFLFKDKNVTNYVDGEIVSEYDNDIPVVSTSSIIVRPYLDSNVSILEFIDTKPFCSLSNTINGLLYRMANTHEWNESVHIKNAFLSKYKNSLGPDT